MILLPAYYICAKCGEFSKAQQIQIVKIDKQLCTSCFDTLQKQWKDNSAEVDFPEYVETSLLTDQLSEG